MTPTLNFVRQLWRPTILGVGLAMALNPDAAMASSPGASAAEHHVRFAQLLSSEGARFESAEFDEMTEEIERHDCTVTDAAKKLIPAGREKIAQALASDYCRPWSELWDEGFKCDSKEFPVSCSDEEAMLARLDLDGYFSGLGRGLREVKTDLERENLAYIVLMSASTHVMSDFDDEPMDRWSSDIVSAYMSVATPDQLVEFVRQFDDTWVGLTPKAKTLLRQYLRDNKTISPKARKQLTALLAKEDS